VKDEIDGPIDVDVAGDVVLDEVKIAVRQVGDVRDVTGDQIVDADGR
jgi:hypothetical protein